MRNIASYNTSAFWSFWLLSACPYIAAISLRNESVIEEWLLNSKK